jgi:hypothetical protein
MAKTILAVAIGEYPEQITINSDPPPAGVRPYIAGLIEGLRIANFKIGANADYLIDYNQCPASQLGAFFSRGHAVDAVFCMSTRVVDEALHPFGNNSNVAIVGVVSDYGKYAATTNLCGFSAQRFQTATDLYDRFLLTVPGLSDIYVLHQPAYNPSAQAYSRISAARPRGAKAVPIVDVSEGQAPNITAALDSAHIPQTAGVLVLPIDRCFGAATAIIDWSKRSGVPTFWPVTDWVDTTFPCALGGYGVSQHLCGARMANKLAAFWANGNMPAQPFADCVASDFSWIASANAARSLGLTLGSPAGLTII